MDKELINYISRGRGAGVLDEELRDVLLNAGWSPEEINIALTEAGSHLPIINALPTAVEPPLEWTNAHRGVFWLVIITIAAVFLGVAGVFAYQSYVQKQSPEQVTVDMLEALAKASGFNYDGTFDLNLNYQSSVVGNSTSSVPLPDVVVDERSTTTLSFAGSVSAPEGKRPSFLLSGKTKVDRLNQGVFNANLEGRLIDDELYLFLSEIDRLPLLDLQSLVGFWVSVTPVDMAKLGLGSSITAPSVNQFLAWRSAIAHSQSFHLTSALGPEKINNIDTVKYAFALDLGDSRYLFDQLAQVTGSSDLSSRVAALSGQDSVMGEIWLGADDNLPYKINLSSAFSDNSKSDSANGYFRLSLNFKDFNQKVSIDKPANYRLVYSVFQELIETATSTKP